MEITECHECLQIPFLFLLMPPTFTDLRLRRSRNSRAIADTKRPCRVLLHLHCLLGVCNLGTLGDISTTTRIQDVAVQKKKKKKKDGHYSPLEDPLGDKSVRPHLLSVGQGAGVVGDESEWVIWRSTATARRGHRTGLQGSGHGRMQSARHSPSSKSS